MKKTISFVIAAAAVAMAMVSCTKETPAGKDSENGVNPDGTRALTVSFAKNATKTTLDADGITPVWAEGDEISLNRVNVSIPADAVGQSSCTIYTSITGPITAVYPAKAHILSEPHFKVSDTQDGSFGCANICIADIESNENELKFENVTAVFAVPVPDGTTALTLTVTSLGKIDPQTGQRGTEKAAISTTENGSDAYEIRVNNKYYDTPSSNDFVYVAVKVDEETGVLLADLNFDLQYKDSESNTHYAQGGVSPNYIKSKGQDPLGYKVVAGTIYSPVLHEYVIIGEGENARKWATMNVGATTSNPNGDYFMWGYTVGHTATTPDTGAFANQDFKDGERGNNEKGFAWDNYIKFTSDTYSSSGKRVFTKYVPSAKESEYGDGGTFSDDKPTLDLADDAANANWGGSWRMPTKVEFVALTGESGIWETNGCKFGTSPNQIFLPAAGYGYETGLGDAGFTGNYWSSSLDTDLPYRACYLFFDESYAYMENDNRYYGYPVRALSE